MNIKKGQIWISKEMPYKSIRIVDIGEVWDKTDSGMYCIWEIANKKEWDKFVCKKFGYSDIDECIRNRVCGTYPYAFNGEKSIKSIKEYIRKNKLILVNDTY